MGCPVGEVVWQEFIPSTPSEFSLGQSAKSLISSQWISEHCRKSDSASVVSFCGEHGSVPFECFASYEAKAQGVACRLFLWFVCLSCFDRHQKCLSGLKPRDKEEGRRGEE